MRMTFQFKRRILRMQMRAEGQGRREREFDDRFVLAFTVIEIQIARVNRINPQW
jgi:hypothetical protein